MFCDMLSHHSHYVIAVLFLVYSVHVVSWFVCFGEWSAIKNIHFVSIHYGALDTDIDFIWKQWPSHVFCPRPIIASECKRANIWYASTFTVMFFLRTFIDMHFSSCFFLSFVFFFHALFMTTRLILDCNRTLISLMVSCSLIQLFRLFDPIWNRLLYRLWMHWPIKMSKQRKLCGIKVFLWSFVCVLWHEHFVFV